jgi:hypothetical protein
MQSCSNENKAGVYQAGFQNKALYRTQQILAPELLLYTYISSSPGGELIADQLTACFFIHPIKQFPGTRSVDFFQDSHGILS